MRHLLLPLLALTLFGCPADENPDDTDPATVVEDVLPLEGSWTDDFGGTHDVTKEEWAMGGIGTFHILDIDYAGEFLVAQNDEANGFNPSLYSRMDWAVDGDDLYFCQVAFDAASEADARNTDAADASDFTMGCGGFGWSALQ